MSQPSDQPPPPEWAIKQAHTALRGGMSAPEVQQRLVAVGLAPEIASAVVKRAHGEASAPPPMVDWAMEHARAALRAGLRVPDIERQLIAKGLTPEVAEAVVTNVLGERVRGDQPDTPARERRRMLHRAASGVVACGCVALGYWYGGGLSAGIALFWVLAPLACVWFGEATYFQFIRFRREPGAPALMFRWIGWFILAAYFLYRLERVLYKP